MEKSKEDLEKEKLELEIIELRKRWFHKPQVIFGSFAALAAVFGVVGENIRSDIKAERTLLAAEKAELRAENAKDKEMVARKRENKLRSSIEDKLKEYSKLSNEFEVLQKKNKELSNVVIQRELAGKSIENEDAQDIQLKAEQFEIAKAIESGGESWSFIGTYRNGMYIDPNFDVNNMPNHGDIITALKNVNRRKDKPRLSLTGWKMGTVVGALTSGDKVRVTGVERIPAKGGGTQDWIKGVFKN
jgi:hypothetical protein